MPESSRFSSEVIPNSITTNTSQNGSVDQNQPLTFIQWVEYNRAISSNISDLLIRYQNYLNNWYIAKNLQPEINQISIKDLYVNLLNEIILNYTSVDEKRFLKNIDTNDPKDLSIAVPFFAQKIKDICVYYSTLRDKAQNASLEYNLKGSNYGLKNLIYNEISKALENQDLTELIRSLNLTVSSVRNDILVDIEELYDLYPNYYDLGTLPASAYLAYTGQRNEYFDFNTYTIKPDLYIDFDQAIVDAIKEYPFFLIELGSNNFSIAPSVSSNELNYLKDSDFITNINDNKRNNLKLFLESALTTKFIGTDFYYLSTGSTASQYVSGKLFDAEASYANYLNKNTPTVAAIPSLDYLFSAKNIGLFFKPDKVGLLAFNNFNFTYSLNADTLSSNFVYIFPDPNLFGNVVGGTRQDQTTPLSFFENNYVLRTGFANSYKFGDPINDPLLPTLKGYQSREQTINHSNQGLSRYIDPQDFFNKEKKDIWANADVFPLVPSIEYPIEKRLETLLSIDKTLVQYKSDVYGNEFGLYKYVEPAKNTSDILQQSILQEADNLCLILDGHTFYDLVSGFNFDYTLSSSELGYSGIILKTTNNIPPGSGYFTHASSITGTSPLSAFYYNNGIPTFALSTVPESIVSYLFQPESFCSNVITTTFDCNVRDGFSFVSPNSGLLTDYPSDDSSFNPAVTQVYYDILADAGVSPISPDFRATFAYAGTFLYTPPVSAVTDYYGNFFVVSAFSDQFTPCNDVYADKSDFFLEEYYLNYNLPQRNTVYVPTISSNLPKQTLYKTKFVNYGDFYYRNSNTSLVAPVSTALSGIFIKYSADVQSEVYAKTINFDVYYDILQIETENYVIFDKIEFNYESNLPRTSSNNELVVKRGAEKEFDKISTVWFNEAENNLVFAKTNLFYQNSASNFKIIYPVIYSLDLDSLNLIQIYPPKPVNSLTINDLLEFSLSGTAVNINIISVDKPIMSYSNESGLYSLTYLARDASDIFYIFVTTFKYFNGILSNIKNVMYRPTLDLTSLNFSNDLNYLIYGSYSVAGSGGSISGGTFIF
jgi:hypothetical protein